MTDLRRVSNTFSVAGQLSADSLPAIKAAGFHTLICNRPDNEAPGQPAHATLDRLAVQLGMAVHFLPVVHPIGAQQLREFTALLDKAEAPVLAWCRSGLRSITLWSLAQVLRGADPAAVEAQARAAGYDLRGFADNYAPLLAEVRRTAG